MKINMAVLDRILRLMLGVLALAWGIAGGPWWSFLGLYLVITASWRFCPLYSLLLKRNQ